MTLPPTVLHAAKRARQWGDAAARTGRAPRWDSTLCGACATVSARLLQALHARGYRARAGINDSHVFVLLKYKGTEWIIDCTATQFNSNLPPVFITPRDDNDARWYHEVQYIAHCARGITWYMRRLDWPSCLHENLTLLKP